MPRSKAGHLVLLRYNVRWVIGYNQNFLVSDRGRNAGKRQWQKQRAKTGGRDEMFCENKHLLGEPLRLVLAWQMML
jgi:hypothetical protein